MSKLDIIVLECINKVLDQKQEKLGDYIDPTKQQIKDLMLEIVDTTKVLGPPHPQSNIYIDELYKKIEAL